MPGTDEFELIIVGGGAAAGLAAAVSYVERLRELGKAPRLAGDTSRSSRPRPAPSGVGRPDGRPLDSEHSRISAILACGGFEGDRADAVIYAHPFGITPASGRVRSQRVRWPGHQRAVTRQDQLGVPDREAAILRLSAESRRVLHVRGLRGDSEARVVAAKGAPIPGLYAAGEIVGVYYHAYPAGTPGARWT
jgi:hypothetical protein